MGCKAGDWRRGGIPGVGADEGEQDLRADGPEQGLSEQPSRGGSPASASQKDSRLEIKNTSWIPPPDQPLIELYDQLEVDEESQGCGEKGCWLAPGSCWTRP